MLSPTFFSAGDSSLPRPPGYRFYRRLQKPAALAVCLLVTATSAWSQEHFKPDLVRKYGGLYASSCNNPNAARLRVMRDALVVEQGDKRIVGHRVNASYAYLDQSPPPYFKIALLSKVHSGASLGFMVFEDATGISIRVQADAPLQVALGKVLLSAKYRRCDEILPPIAAASTTQNEPMSDAEKMLLNPQFKANYLRILGPLARERWLSRLDGPRPPARRVRVSGMDYLLLAICKPHDCNENNAVLLYAEDRDRLFAKVNLQGRTSTLGEPPPDVTDTLDALWAEQWRRR